MAKSTIIKELANNQISMEVALQRLLIIASDLDNEELSAWAEAELRGYSQTDTLPEYRNIQSIHFIYSGINGSFKVTNCPFTFTNVLEDILSDIYNVPIMDSVSSLQNFVDNPDKQSYRRDFSMLNGLVLQRTGIQCTSIYQTVPLNFLQNILSQIKTILMNIFLKLDKEYGCLDNLDVDTTVKTPEEVEKINKVVNNYIFVDNSINVGDKNKLKDSGILGGGRGHG